jgi:hypothetical protein
VLVPSPSGSRFPFEVSISVSSANPYLQSRVHVRVHVRVRVLHVSDVKYPEEVAQFQPCPSTLMAQDGPWPANT